ncbi:MAG: GWxTD domain-containing protein [Candidatus Cloacimonetes bacterium]|nr:GWxTD domain-containing protein [Candidatus Cloacimonadota bacterium]
MKKWISITLLALIAMAIWAQEVIFEHYEEATDFWVLVPYNSLNFPKDALSVNYQLSMEIRNSRKKLVASLGQMLNLPRSSWLEDTAIPVHLSAKLDAGKYETILQLRNLALGDVHTQKKSFHIQEHTQIGQPYLLAQREDIRFLPQSLDLDAGHLQSCEILQSFAIAADSVVISTPDYRWSIPNPQSPLQISLMIDQGIPESIKITFWESNIYYQMEPFMYSPWFSYNQRYSLEDQRKQLRYLATQNEWQSLSNLSSNKLAEGIELFWSSHDPSPGTARNETRELFYYRVLKADEMFSLHKRLKGWASDRGRIYIKYGEPDEVYENILPLDEYPTFVWRYYKENLEFIFSDLGGFGQYILRNKDEEY